MADCLFYIMYKDQDFNNIQATLEPTAILGLLTEHLLANKQVRASISVAFA